MSLLSSLYPGALMVVGASADPTKRGFQSVRALLRDGFQGAIYPINPKLTELQGLVCYPDIQSVPGQPELALICTPAISLPDVLQQCGLKGVQTAIVLASGFAESGSEGEALQQQSLAVAQRYGVRLIGPNTSGVFNTHARMNLVGFSDLHAGPLGILSQSGNMALSLVTEGSQQLHSGFSSYIGVGNAADLGFHDYLDYFAADQGTGALVAYLEGLTDGRAFLQAARRFTARKPLVLYKSGKSESGQKAARSHTGALAGSYQVARGVMRQAGVVLVEQPDHLLPVAEALATQPLPQGRRIAILADGGGHATIAADALDALGLTLAELSPTTQDGLKALLPRGAAVSNPVDVAGGTDSDPLNFARCAELLLQDPGVDQLLLVGLFGGYALRFDVSLADAERLTAVQLAELARMASKPLLVHSLYALSRPKPLQQLVEQGIPVYAGIDAAVAALKALADYAAYRQRGEQDDLLTGQGEASLRAARLLTGVRQQGRTALLEPEARQLLGTFEVPLPEACWLQTPDELQQLDGQWLEQPLAMKVVSRDVLHKSDAGGVKLNLLGLAALQRGWQQIEQQVLSHQPEARLEGMLLAPMASAPGTEVIIGVTHDSQYGHLLMFGLGGIFVEVLKDVVFRALPLSRADAWDMLAGIQSARVLEGVRGQPPVDKQALVELLLKVSALVVAHPEIEELDLNPVRCHREGYTLLDARVLLATAASGAMSAAGAEATGMAELADGVQRLH
ncbi:acetate--CoA ligase family protein [Marinospirillum alkaliphilum]|uniref:Acetyltransferase n=1 Tax=Marinospirillum alkaliphilum DSM 21637 TaxID=1122209 RepID=A0A1K1UDK9_9GAMM|nr:acetate--CoA ligase [Marinospirillum alkaliphilum]SFX10896.1 acetyltransferase [Marinospirillum alkaliphilum DSM 21637]